MLQELPTPNYQDIFEWVKVIATLITLIFSLTSLILTIILYRAKDKKEDKETARKLKIDWFNKLILDYNLQYFHKFFSDLETALIILKTPGLTDESKQKIFDDIKDFHKDFRLHFADSLLAVDARMYDKIMAISDKLIDDFTNMAFDAGINLSHTPKYEEMIPPALSRAKTEMIKELFKYKGDTDNNTSAIVSQR